MSGLRNAFDEIVADVPAYGDLDRAIEQADRERRRRYAAVVGLAAAAAVLTVVAGVAAVSQSEDSAPPISPSPAPATPSPTPEKSQSPRTWADTPTKATYDGPDWEVPDPLDAVRDAWFAVVAQHLDPTGEDLEAQETYPWGGNFERPSDDSIYSTFGNFGVIVDRGELNLFDDGCGYLLGEHQGPPDGQESCSTEMFVAPGGERARISSWERRCSSWDPGSEGDDARPGPGSTYATCGDYVVAVAVEHRDGLVGFVKVDGRGTADFNPFSRTAMAAAAADPRLTLPETAFSVPTDQALVSVVLDHVPGYTANTSFTPPHPGSAETYGKLGPRGLRVTVRPAGGPPACGSTWLVDCVERHVFGADDPTTVYVGSWAEEDWASCCPKNSRAERREVVYVGPRHTVVAWLGAVVPEDEKTLGAELDQRLIDLVLDPRLQ